MKEEKKNRSILLTIPATGTAALSFNILGHSSNSIAMRAYLRIIYTIACDCYFFVSFISLFISVFACKHTHRHRVCSVWNHWQKSFALERTEVENCHRMHCRSMCTCYWNARQKYRRSATKCSLLVQNVVANRTRLRIVLDDNWVSRASASGSSDQPTKPNLAPENTKKKKKTVYISHIHTHDIWLSFRYILFDFFFFCILYFLRLFLSHLIFERVCEAVCGVRCALCAMWKTCTNKHKRSRVCIHCCDRCYSHNPWSNVALSVCSMRAVYGAMAKAHVCVESHISIVRGMDRRQSLCAESKYTHIFVLRHCELCVLSVRHIYRERERINLSLHRAVAFDASVCSVYTVMMWVIVRCVLCDPWPCDKWTMRSRPLCVHVVMMTAYL